MMIANRPGTRDGGSFRRSLTLLTRVSHAGTARLPDPPETRYGMHRWDSWRMRRTPVRRTAGIARREGGASVFPPESVVPIRPEEDAEAWRIARDCNEPP